MHKIGKNSAKEFELSQRVCPMLTEHVTKTIKMADNELVLTQQGIFQNLSYHIFCTAHWWLM